jgi:hypothetical protein
MSSVLDLLRRQDELEKRLAELEKKVAAIINPKQSLPALLKPKE